MYMQQFKHPGHPGHPGYAPTRMPNAQKMLLLLSAPAGIKPSCGQRQGEVPRVHGGKVLKWGLSVRRRGYERMAMRMARMGHMQTGTNDCAKHVQLLEYESPLPTRQLS